MKNLKLKRFLALLLAVTMLTAQEGIGSLTVYAKQSQVEVPGSNVEASGQDEALAEQQEPEKVPEETDTAEKVPENEADFAADSQTETGSTPKEEELPTADTLKTEEPKADSEQESDSKPKADSEQEADSKQETGEVPNQEDKAAAQPEAMQQEKIPEQQEAEADAYVEQKKAFVNLLSDHAVYAILNKETLAVKELPEENAQDVLTIASGHQLKLTGVEIKNDTVWFQVEAAFEDNTYTGYIQNKYVVSSDQGFLSWKAQYGIDDIYPEGEVNATGAGKTNIQAFPASYQGYIQSMIAAHPEWTFVPMNTGLDWNEVILNEMVLTRNLVPAYSMNAWKSTSPDAYNPATGVWNEYSGGGWVQASESIVRYYIDPRNFLNESSVFQFELLTFNSGYHTEQGVNAILKNTFMYNKVLEDGSEGGITYAQAFMKIGAALNVSPYFLAGRIRQEQGVKGDNPLISGTYPGYEGLYNYFNMKASGLTAEEVIINGLNEARDYGWNSRYRSLYGGAQNTVEKFISKGQDTFYLQKFDVESSHFGQYWHQYMQNLLAADNEGKSVRNGYADMGVLNNSFVFKVPVYNNMPGSACPRPVDTLSTPTLRTSVKDFTTVSLSWSEVGGAGGYYVYRSENQSSGYKKVATITSVGTTSWSHTATPGKVYYYKVRAYKDIYGGPILSPLSDIKSASTKIPKPSVINLKQYSYNKVGVYWRKVSGATGYTIYRKTGKNGTYKRIKTVNGASSVSYADTTAVPNQVYYYKIRAYKVAKGNNYYSSFQTEKSVSTKLAPVKISSGKSYSYSKVKLTWAKQSSITAYQIYRKTGKNGTYKKIKSISGSSNVSYTDTDIKPNQVYYYKIRTYKTVNGKNYYAGFSPEKSVSTKLGAVSFNSVKTTAYTKVSVSWKQVSGVSGYIIYRKTGKKGSYQKIKQISGSNVLKYTDTTASPNQTYYYSIRSYRTVSGKKYYSGLNKGKSVSTKMAAPAIVSAARSGSGRLLLRWESRKWISGYQVYRSSSKDGSYKLIADVDKRTQTTYLDKAVEANITYYYRIRSYVNVKGKPNYSPYSNVVMTKMELTVPVLSPVAVSSVSSVKLKWDMTAGASGYKLYRATSSNGTYQQIKNIADNKILSYTDKNLKKNKKYFYKIRSYSTVNGKIMYSKASAVFGTTAKVKEKQIKSITNVSTNKAKISWDISDQATGYVLYRADSLKGSYRPIKTITGKNTVSYTNTGLKKGKKYYYKVRVFVNTNGNKQYSAYSQAWSIQTKK